VLYVSSVRGMPHIGDERRNPNRSRSLGLSTDEQARRDAVSVDAELAI